jgi:UDP-glucose 4-epimerase
MNRLRCLEINVEGTKHVIEACIQHRVGKVVYASSSEVYGEPLSNPIDEHARTYGKSVYAISKLAGEELCRAYAQRYKWFNFTILRYFNTFGPYQTAQFVIPRFIANVLNGEPPVIYGDGMQERSYCYVSDIATGTINAALQDNANGELFNLGNGQQISTLWSLAKTVIAAAGKEGQIKPVQQPDFNLTDRAVDREILNRFCDTTKARQILNYAPKVSLEEGIKRVMNSGAIIFDHWATGDLAYLQDEDV